MHELDRRLQELALQAQSYQTNTDPRRRRIIQELWDTMLPSSTLQGRRSKPTDGEARRRLSGIKNRSRAIYGTNLAGDFEEDWQDALAAAQKEILQNINIYQKGVDSELYKVWLKFCTTLPQQQTPEVYSKFQEQVASFRRRFEQRRRNKKTQIYPPEKSRRLAQSCEHLCQNIQNSEVDLQQAWNTFCNEVQQLYRPLKFWNWFVRYLQFRFIDLIRKRQREVSADAPIATGEQNTESETLIDRIQSKAKLSRDEIRLIREDPDGIFRNKHIRNFPDVNFQAIALLKMQNASLKELESHFGDRVNAQTTISPFYTRSCCYFKPILEEYLEARIALPQSAIEQIVSDSEGKYNRRRMPDRPQITFKGIIQARSEGLQSWKILARQLQVNVGELIYFYLDCISYFKLIPQTKTRTRRNQNDSQP